MLKMSFILLNRPPYIKHVFIWNFCIFFEIFHEHKSIHENSIWINYEFWHWCMLKVFLHVENEIDFVLLSTCVRFYGTYLLCFMCTSTTCYNTSNDINAAFDWDIMLLPLPMAALGPTISLKTLMQVMEVIFLSWVKNSEFFELNLGASWVSFLNQELFENRN